MHTFQSEYNSDNSYKANILCRVFSKQHFDPPPFDEQQLASTSFESSPLLTAAAIS
jgi:hypothetical protein